MLLIPERQALFLHIPKTGGQTIEALLGVPHQRHHHSPRGLPPDWPRWFRFTFVRHPYSRFVSTCNFNLAMARRHRERYRRQPEPDPLVGLRLWLLERQPPLGAVVQRLAGERQLLRLCHFRPQVRSLRLVQPQFVGRFERFTDDVNTVLAAPAGLRATAGGAAAPPEQLPARLQPGAARSAGAAATGGALPRRFPAAGLPARAGRAKEGLTIGQISQDINESLWLA